MKKQEKNPIEWINDLREKRERSRMINKERQNRDRSSLEKRNGNGK